MRVELHLEASAELRAAAVWYEERRAGLGEDFVAEGYCDARLAAADQRKF